MPKNEDFDGIYSEYYPQIYKYLLSLCKSEDLAEEITQETFFKVLKSIDRYRGDCKLSVWMCQIAKNTLFSHLKKQKHSGLPIAEPDITLRSSDDVEQLLTDKETAARLHEILHSIGEPYREVFWMKTFGELSFAEIGRVHGKTENWARVTYHRAKMKIKEGLE